MEDTEKTEEPTPERRNKARSEGQFPRARDAGNTAATIAVMMAMLGYGPTALEKFHAFTVRCFNDSFAVVGADPGAFLHQAIQVFIVLSVPLALAASVGGVAIGFWEAGFQPNWGLLEPKMSRLDPLNKLKQMFNPPETLVNIALQLTRVAVVAVVAYYCMKESTPALIRLASSSLPGALKQFLDSLLELTLWSTLALIGLAGMDYAHSKYRHEKSIMMSRQEIKDEMRQHEGDPKVKQQQRARAREIVKRGLAKAVREADFVVANPTHVSVAIRYRSAEGAPVVVAKGVDEIALHIQRLAKEYDVPVIRNVPLARALAARVKLGRAIPVDLYAAVAEILAFVYRLKRRAPAIVS